MAGVLIFVGLGARGDRLGSAYLNEVCWVSRLVISGSLSGCRDGIPSSERLMWPAPFFR